MSQAPFPFTQAASQGYGDYSATIEDDDDDDEKHQTGEDEPIPDGPQSPEPEEQETDEYGFTQTQERSYPAGADSPDPDEDLGPESPSQEMSEEEEKPIVSSRVKHRVQIMNDSDNEEVEESPQKKARSSGNRDFLKQFILKDEESPKKKHKKRHHDESRPEKHPKRSRKQSSEEEIEEQHQEQAGEEEEEEAAATSDVEDVVDDIFGKDADDQDEVAAELADLNDQTEEEQADGEGEGEGEQEIEAEAEPDHSGTYDDDADDEPRPTKRSNETVKKNTALYELEVFLERKSQERRGRRRGRGANADSTDTNIDDIAKKLIDQMTVAAEEDRIFNQNQQPATAKLLLLPLVEQQLRRADSSRTFLENGVLTAFKEWLSPLPDKSLPNIKIRESLLRIIPQFGMIEVDYLKDSGIGKALIYLYKHPRETKENKIKLIKIIHDMARSTFNLDTSQLQLSREEREQRDADQATLKRQSSLTGKQKNRSADVDLPFANNQKSGDDDDANREDDCPRARVPRASNKDYVVRPVSKVKLPEQKSEGKQKTMSRLDELKRRQQDRKRQEKSTSIVKLSIEGNRMHL